MGLRSRDCRRVARYRVDFAAEECERDFQERVLTGTQAQESADELVIKWCLLRLLRARADVPSSVGALAIGSEFVDSRAKRAVRG